MIADLTIRNCQIVRHDGIFPAGIAIEGGKIASVSKDDILPKARREVDARGKYLFPGLIDPHCHLGLYRPFDEDCRSETRAAAAGGVTLVITMLLHQGSYPDHILTQKAIAENESMVDFAFDCRMILDRHIEEIEECAHIGVSSFKFHTGYRGTEVINLGQLGPDDAFLYRGFEAAAVVERPARVHCENTQIINSRRKQLERQGRIDLSAWYEARPRLVEIMDILKVIEITKRTRNRLCIVHMSSLEGVAAVADAQTKGVEVLGETCPHYLCFTKDEPWGILGKVNPSIKDDDCRQALWQGIAQGVIGSIGTDHCAVEESRKRGNGDIWSALAGFPGMQTMLPALISEGYEKGRLKLEDIARLCSYNTARFYGFYPRKGVIEVGADADLSIVDLDKTVTYHPSLSYSSSGFDLFTGRTLRGWPVLTMVRGQIVFDDGKIVGTPGMGRFILPKEGIEKDR